MCRSSINTYKLIVDTYDDDDDDRSDRQSVPNKYFKVWNLSELWEKSPSCTAADPYRAISIYTQWRPVEKDISAIKDLSK